MCVCARVCVCVVCVRAYACAMRGIRVQGRAREIPILDIEGRARKIPVMDIVPKKSLSLARSLSLSPQSEK